MNRKQRRRQAANLGGLLATPRNTGVATRQVLIDAIGLKPEEITSADEQRMEGLLLACDCVLIDQVFEGQIRRVWVGSEVATKGGYQPLFPAWYKGPNAATRQ